MTGGEEEKKKAFIPRAFLFKTGRTQLEKNAGFEKYYEFSCWGRGGNWKQSLLQRGYEGEGEKESSSKKKPKNDCTLSNAVNAPLSGGSGEEQMSDYL